MAEELQGRETGLRDVEQNKVMAIIGYIFPIVFFIPLLTEAKNSAFARFHANQQLLLLLFGMIGYVAAAVLTVIYIGIILFPVITIASIVFMILGIINAVNGSMKQLPIIGGISLIR